LPLRRVEDPGRRQRVQRARGGTGPAGLVLAGVEAETDGVEIESRRAVPTSKKASMRTCALLVGDVRTYEPRHAQPSVHWLPRLFETE
jgi:hypothetical protein